VLSGGSDVWPGSYGESPLKPEWAGDRVRDEYEIALLRAFIDAGEPVLGVCRGLQVLNVAFGGTLYQDIATQKPGSHAHRVAALYDQNFHPIEFVTGTRLADLYRGTARAMVNSVHHQGIKDLAPGFVVEAVAADDGIIEAIRRPGPAYVAAVQWHPEFHDWTNPAVLNGDAILEDFLAAARIPKKIGV
jgi:putative glutamine amidotransferase